MHEDFQMAFKKMVYNKQITIEESPPFTQLAKVGSDMMVHSCTSWQFLLNLYKDIQEKRQHWADALYQILTNFYALPSASKMAIIICEWFLVPTCSAPNIHWNHCLYKIIYFLKEKHHLDTNGVAQIHSHSLVDILNLFRWGIVAHSALQAAVIPVWLASTGVCYFHYCGTVNGAHVL